MNIEQANAIPLAQILEKIGYKPVKLGRREQAYLSPFRSERTASFYVNTAKNVWFDHGETRGGDCIAFVVRWLESNREASTVSDALRWLKNMTGGITIKLPPVPPDETSPDPTVVLKQTKPLQHPALIKYLKARGISLDVAKGFLVEATLSNLETKKSFFAIGMKNEEDGYELRNQFFKGCIQSKAITFIRGKMPNPSGIHLFEGMMDYGAALEYNKTRNLDDDAIILNSVTCLKDAPAYIKGYGYQIAYTWLDNDTAGKRASKFLTEFFQTQQGLTHKSMNSLYEKHKDVNAWHMHCLGLSL